MLYFPVKNPLISIALLLFLAGCDQGSDDASFLVEDSLNPGVQLSSNVVAAEINSSVTLSWTTSGMDSCVASGDWSGDKSVSGTETIESVSSDSTFILTCTGPEGEFSDSLDITVNEPQPPTLSLAANPSNVVINGSTMLNWTALGATECTASGDWTGARNLSGSQTIDAITTDSSFVLTCSGAGGSVTESVDVGVFAPSAPIVNLSANPLSIAYDGSTTLSWSSDNVSSCTASGDWSGSRSASGSETIGNLTSNSSFMLSCSGAGGTATDSVNITVAAPPVPTVNLATSSSNVPYNGSATLSWSSNDASSCTASGDWSGSKATSGSQTLSALTTNGSYTLSCTGIGGTRSQSVNIAVAAPPLPTINLSASPSNVSYEGSTTLSWSSQNATDCTASGAWSGSKSTSGSQTFNTLTADSTYSLSCTGVGGSQVQSVNVTVAAPSAPTLNLAASPANVSYDGSTTLSWSTTDTDDCTASGGWSGSKATSGSETISSLVSDTIFDLSCTGSGGTVSDSVSVTVAAPAAPTVNLSASPSNVAYDGSTTVSWSSTDADDCTASGGWSGNKAASGSETISALTADTTFDLSCTGSGGTAGDSVSITVAAPSAPTVNLTASPTTVPQDGSTTLSWTTSDATSCTASGDWSGSKATSGSETISSLAADSQFTLTCDGVGGSANDSVNITVTVSSTGTALLSWTPPTENTDGSSLTDLAGYRIRYGTSPTSYSETITINDPGIASYLVEDLSSATWYFVVTSFNTSGAESSYSTEVSTTIN